MKNYQNLIGALLTVIAIEGAMTTCAVMEIARNGFQMELNITEAEDLLNKAKVAQDAAFTDMEEEELSDEY